MARTCGFIALPPRAHAQLELPRALQSAAAPITSHLAARRTRESGPRRSAQPCASRSPHALPLDRHEISPLAAAPPAFRELATPPPRPLPRAYHARTTADIVSARPPASRVYRNGSRSVAYRRGCWTIARSTQPSATPELARVAVCTRSPSGRPDVRPDARPDGSPDRGAKRHGPLAQTETVAAHRTDQ